MKSWRVVSSLVCLGILTILSVFALRREVPEPERTAERRPDGADALVARTPALPEGLSVRVVPSVVSYPDAQTTSSPEAQTLASRLRVALVPSRKKMKRLEDVRVEANAARETYRTVPATGQSTAPALSGIRPGSAAVPIGGAGINVDSLTIDDNAGFILIPPDPIGAVGIGHAVNVVNSSLAIHDKATGALLTSTLLFDFFATAGAQTLTFDPKVIYDQYEDRFVIITLEVFQPPLTSRVLVAVSDDGDPFGTWYQTSIDTLLTINGPTFSDYPGLGLDEEAVYVTTNQFSLAGSFEDGRIHVIDKTDFYAGGTAVVSTLTPTASAAFNFTLQPAHMFGAHPDPSTGNYFTAYNGLNSGGADRFLLVYRLIDPLGSPSFDLDFVNLGAIDTLTGAGNAPQPAPDVPVGIDAGDRRTYNSVWRDGSLYATTLVNPNAPSPDNNQNTAHWVRMDSTAIDDGGTDCQAVSSGCLADQGDVGGEDLAAQTHTYYPAVAVDSAGNMGLGFSASGPGLLAGAFFTFHAAGDPPGTVQAAQTARAGVDLYQRIDGSGFNRWGDYSGLAVCPVSECFWQYNQYALTRSIVDPPPNNGAWGTVWAEH
jgi:hypothetical protein